MNPITREEHYLAAIAGDEVEIPSNPLTRIEAYLARIADRIGTVTINDGITATDDGEANVTIGEGAGSGVSDVQINGTSIVSDGVANIESSDLDFVETVSGSTPSITAEAGMRYVCGEVSTLSFTPSNTGVCDVIFESGSTPTVLTIPNTVKFPAWFDPTNLDADTVYEINILNGVYGAVMAWA